MPKKDDGVVYWLETPELAFANDRHAAVHPYWLSFRDAGVELFRAYDQALELPVDIETTWSTPRFQVMQDEYAKLNPCGGSRAGAFSVIRKYQRMCVLRLFDCTPIRLLTRGDGMRPENPDHIVRIDGGQWHYAALNGNHRLMSALYVGIDLVPVLCESKP